MNFLELAQRLAQESGTVPGRAQPSSVLNQDGRLAKVVDWTQQAWMDIQNRHAEWRWMKGEFTGAVMTGIREYTPEQLNAVRFAEWVEDVEGFPAVSLYEALEDEAPIWFMDWGLLYATRLRGVQTPSRPDAWSVKGSRTLVLATIPDKDYTIRGAYRKAPQALVENDDVPEMPARFHDLIWLLGLRYALNDDESFNQPVFIREKGRDLMSALERDQLPEIDGPEPIA